MTLYGHKIYQQRVLDDLREYLKLTVETGDADLSFYRLTRRAYQEPKDEQKRPYLPGLPYVCLRLPTGGGKTVVACRAIAVVVETYLLQDRPLVLWLVPSDAILEQTLRALRDPQHPYRQTLEAELPSPITVLNVAEALAMTRATLDAGPTILVTTVQALRVEEIKNRAVYKDNGSLMPHFDALPPEHLLPPLERYEDGKIVPSLANALAVRRPLVIVDEAHNVRTHASFQTLVRFGPSAILEFTATPKEGDFPPNVLSHVAADELKAEGMVKLPILMATDADWKAALRDAKARREELEAQALQLQAETGEHLRPIALLQAQKKGEPVTWDVLLDCLRDELGVPEAQIAVETGDRADLKGVDVMSPACPVRYVITVDKLREGWDCPFAYVLYSARNVSSKTAVEQILGRVLRMPRATRKPEAHDILNRAYAHITSAQFGAAVKALRDSLVESGFEEYEAAANIRDSQQPLPFSAPQTGLFGAPDAPGAPQVERLKPFVVPQLALRWEDGTHEPFDAEEVLDLEWHLLDFPATLSDAEFPAEVRRENIALDVAQGGKLKVGFGSEYVSLVAQHQLSLLPDDIREVAQLATWLDAHIKHPDILQTEAQTWLCKLIEHLIEERRFDLTKLARERLRLKAAVEARIKAHRDRARGTQVQKLLFDGEKSARRVEIVPECSFAFDPDVYPVNKRYEGVYRFRKHFYPDKIADMNNQEADCARFIDDSSLVARWVRNLERQPHAAFWLQTEENRFYPDFVVELEDERVAVVEFKGADRITNDDTKRKQRVGALWEARSNGRGIFLLVGIDDYQARLTAL